MCVCLPLSHSVCVRMLAHVVDRSRDVAREIQIKQTVDQYRGNVD